MSFDFDQPTALREAVQLLSGKTPIGSILRTAEWQKIPLELRLRALFSAGVESARVLQRIHDALNLAITNARGQAEGARKGTGEPGTFKMNRQKFIADIRELALAEGLVPADDALEGTLQDITSEARLDLIFRTNMEQAREYAFWKRGQKQTILDAWPAQELIRVEPRRVPRNWEERWVAAGGEFHQGRMVALKTDEIWTRLSRFGTPWPPFDFNSGMGLKEINREEAIDLGLIEKDEAVEPMEEQFNSRLKASVRGLNPTFKDALKTIFGEQIDVSGDDVQWVLAAQANN